MEFSRSETCKFIADHAEQIAKMADAAKLPVLSHLANMMRVQAQIDAQTVAAPKRAA